MSSISDVKDYSSFAAYVDHHYDGNEQQYIELIQALAKIVFSNDYYDPPDISEFLKVAIFRARRLHPDRANKIRQLLEKFYKNPVDVSASKEEFIEANKQGKRLKSLTELQAINYACEVGEELKKFDLGLYNAGARVTLEDMKRLAKACPNIQEFNLGRIYFRLGFGEDTKVMDFIFELSNLESLRIGGRTLENDFCKRLSKLERLKKLNISFCNFNDDSIEQLTPLKNIEILVLLGKSSGYGGFRAALTDKVFKFLLSFPKLKKVDLTGQVGIDPASIEEFKKAHPDIEVVTEKIYRSSD